MRKISGTKPYAALIPIAAVALFALLTAAYAESTFRKDFIESYTQNKFENTAVLVKKNRAIIPGEIKSLIAEAQAGDKPFEERMRLLDIANAMASMLKYWHGDGAPLADVENALRAEIKKEQERVTEQERWDKYEKFPGNLLMKEREAEMNSMGVAPVIYPHWVHSLWFECKVCHDAIFAMRRGANAITQDKILKGELCGRCHDGKSAFGADKDCERCHIAGEPGWERLRDVSKKDLNKVNETSKRIGSVFRPEALPGGALPLDRFGFVDWVALRRTGAYEPVKSLDGGEADEIRDNSILFEALMPDIKNVVFNHRTHSSIIKCAGCHNGIFKDTLGGNRVRMSDMAAGKFCGYCHGKVAFNFADCTRCHEWPKGVKAEGALMRVEKP